ncbi:MAG TPA: hypothetical protein VK420_20060 [Longimicrobium sp.]|nr:hypothetical protein [Longimicrobium sp.]
MSLLDKLILAVQAALLFVAPTLGARAALDPEYAVPAMLVGALVLSILVYRALKARAAGGLHRLLVALHARDTSDAVVDSIVGGLGPVLFLLDAYLIRCFFLLPPLRW